MSDLTVPKGDFGYNLNFTVKDDDGTVFVLTAYTITMSVWAVDMPETIVVTGACVIDVAASGTCHYVVVSGDFATAGEYLVTLRLTKTDKRETTRQYTLTVEDTP